jgi:hypothetical protein
MCNTCCTAFTTGLNVTCVWTAKPGQPEVLATLSSDIYDAELTMHASEISNILLIEFLSTDTCAAEELSYRSSTLVRKCSSAQYRNAVGNCSSNAHSTAPATSCTFKAFARAPRCVFFTLVGARPVQPEYVAGRTLPQQLNEQIATPILCIAYTGGCENRNSCRMRCTTRIDAHEGDERESRHTRRSRTSESKYDDNV